MRECLKLRGTPISNSQRCGSGLFIPDPGSAALVIPVYLMVFDTLKVSPEELMWSEVVGPTLCLPYPVIDGLQVHRIIAQLKATHMKPALLIRIRDPVPF